MNTRSSRSRSKVDSKTPFTWDMLLDWGMEVIILAILMITPWLFGGYQPYHIHIACCGLVLVLILWSLKQIVRWKLSLYRCAVSILLAVFFLISCMSLIPMPRSALKWLGPEVVRMYDELLPKQQEVPMVGTTDEPLPFLPGTTLSLYPGATQTRLLELLAAMVLFAVVRHGLASPARFKRLAWAMVINGCILSIFAMIQKIRAQAHTVYGVEVPGDVFGPFINRNHFPSYVNFSICLGFGLFLTVMQRKSGSYGVSETGQKTPLSYSTAAWSEFLQHPQAVWLLIPLTVCITAVLASLSRGGILALAVGLGMAVLVWRRKGNGQNLSVLLAIPVLAVGLLIWYGANPTLQRLEQQQEVPEGRFAIWQASWDVFCRFPLLGTGLGTFAYAEPLGRPLGVNQTIMHEHAHNEYMEALVEGGAIRLILTFLLIWLVLRRGWQALDTRQRSSGKAMALGGWAAIITLLVQSIGEFGVHLPAIAGVLAVTAGYLVALGGPRRSESEGDPALIRWNYFGVGPILGTVFALTLGVILFAGTWLNWQSEDYRLYGLKTRMNAYDISDRMKAKGDPKTLKRAVDLLDVAIFYGPAHSRLRMERYEVENQRLQAIEEQERIVLQYCLYAQQLTRVTLGIPYYPVHNTPLLIHETMQDAIEPFLAQMVMSQKLVSRQIDSWKKQQEHLRAARNLCPLAWRPHLDVAEHVVPGKAVIESIDRMLYWKLSDPMQSYLERIKLLHPHRAETWYFCGHQEGISGQREKSLQSWRRSLELSDEFLPQIIEESTQELMQPELKLTTQEIMEKLIPVDSASYYVKAAWILFPSNKQEKDRKPYMEKAIQLLEKKKDFLSPENQFNYGMALWGVNQREQALQYLLVATRAQPGKVIWRIDLARLYYELEKFADAREQSEIVLRAQPGNTEAIELLQKLDTLQRPPK